MGASQSSWKPPPFSIRPPDESFAPDIGDVLHGEEVARARVFFRAILFIAVMTGAFIPMLAGPIWLRAATGSVLVSTATLCIVVLVILRKKERYTPKVATIVGVTCAVLGVAAIYYIGVFSAGAMVLIVGIYFFGSSHSRMAARTTHLTICVLYFIVSAGIAAGYLPDLSLFSTDAAQSFTRWFQVFMSQVIFGFTFYLACSGRRATEGAVDRVNKASVQLKQRDALLEEAKGALEKATRPSEGRHTGTTAGEFLIGDLLGRGAMGEVYKATDAGGLPVAIKLLHPNLIENPDKIKRFLREAEAAAAVHSPHVPRTFGSGWMDDRTSPFLAMELLEGHDLAWHLRKTGRLQLPLVVEMVQHVANALADVRDAGVVHRDLKPANIFLTDSLPRTWKVLDFGLSKLLWESGSLTRDHAIGTPSYMSPEQVRGPTVDHQADL